MTGAKRVHRLVVAIALSLALAVAAAAQPTAPEIADAWARATPAGAKTGAAYATLVNGGTTADRLMAVSTPVAGKAQLHAHLDDAGVLRMEMVAAIELEPGTSTALKPGGQHIMLFELKRPLKQGESFPMAFTFEKAGTIWMQVKVLKAGAMAATDAPAHDMDEMK
jgi:periplasmic copper chaperone A